MPRPKKRTPQEVALQALHGRVRRICIGCQVAEVTMDSTTGLCLKCVPNTPVHVCPGCMVRFRSPYKRHCNACKAALIDARRKSHLALRGPKPPRVIQTDTIEEESQDGEKQEN